MSSRVFLKKGPLLLVSDERDIIVSNQLIDQVIAWCDEHNICAEQVATLSLTQWSFGVNLWRVRDEEQRMWFALKWS